MTYLFVFGRTWLLFCPSLWLLFCFRHSTIQKRVSTSSTTSLCSLEDTTTRQWTTTPPTSLVVTCKRRHEIFALLHSVPGDVEFYVHRREGRKGTCVVIGTDRGTLDTLTAYPFGLVSLTQKIAMIFFGAATMMMMRWRCHGTIPFFCRQEHRCHLAVVTVAMKTVWFVEVVKYM